MPDLPASPDQEVSDKKLFEIDNGKITVTKDNAPMLSVHFLSCIYSRLGYIVKLLENKSNG